MESTEVLVALNLTGLIASRRLTSLLGAFSHPADILTASTDTLAAVPGIGEGIARKIKAVTAEEIRKEFDFCRRNDLAVIARDSSQYPAALRFTADGPILLYVRGELLPEDALAMAVVGSRRATLYGRMQAEKISAELAQKGLTVVSGMARGIDTFAHRAALKAGGRTIAVIGSGFNHLYPEENEALAEKICDAGAVVSEFPVFTEPLACNFPRRNRIISGLALGVLVVEAAANSGALITADFALQQGREVFALPGCVDSPGAAGSNELIRQGAKLVASVEDIIEEFDFLPRLPRIPDQSRQTAAEPGCRQAKALSCTESALCTIISTSGRPLFFDELLEQSRMDLPTVAHALARLELLGLIRKFAGNSFGLPKQY